MPLFDCVCDRCGQIREVLLRDDDIPLCLNCGILMRKMPSYPAMVKIKGEGGYPSRRKFVKGTAPYVSRKTKAWLDEDPLENPAKANNE